jgi:replication factor A1
MDIFYHYNACVECKKKVLNENGGWFCEKCSKTYPTCNMVYNFNLKIEDFTGIQYGQVFGETVGDAVFGMNARDLNAIRGEDQFVSDDLKELLKSKQNIETMMMIKVKMDTYQGNTQSEENRMRY